MKFNISFYSGYNTCTRIIAIMSFTVLLVLVSITNLPQQHSLAQTEITNKNNTSPASSAAIQPQLKGLISQCALTESTVQGPEYLPGAPVKQGKDFADELPGQRLILMGTVLDTNCEPVQGAVLDLWQTNSTGEYDYKGYNLRGKIVTDEDGNYVLHTVYPERLVISNDTARPAHIHVIAGVPGQPLVTTQVYFEDQPKDSALKDSLITIPVIAANGTKIANFDFVVEDYRGFDISQGLAGNPTIGAIG